jgi:hypothetical protein
MSFSLFSFNEYKDNECSPHKKLQQSATHGSPHHGRLLQLYDAETKADEQTSLGIFSGRYNLILKNASIPG